MGMLTQNYYNILKLRSLMFFNSRYGSGIDQNDPTTINMSTSDIIFMSFSSGLTLKFNLPTMITGGESKTSYSVLSVPFYSGTLMYNNPSSYNYYGYTGGHYIYFITNDFEETIDNQYTDNVVSYKAISSSITSDGYTSIVNISYSRTDTTALYGLYIVFGFNNTTLSAITQMVVYNHKFNEPIIDNDFTIQMSFNITSGELNVS